MKKPLFIHIPKAGGSSIYDFIWSKNSDLKGKCLHQYVEKYTKEYRNSCYVFSFTRNPYDRLLSAHNYLTKGYGNKLDTKFGETLITDFNTFVKEQLRISLNWLHFIPMVNWLNDDVDFIGRFENYQDDFRHVCEKIGAPKQELPHKNKSNHRLHYSEYYSDESREIVSEVYAKDIERFGYNFE